MKNRTTGFHGLIRLLAGAGMILPFAFPRAESAPQERSGALSRVATPRVFSRLETAAPDEILALWIFLGDRSGAPAGSAAPRMSSRAAGRRALRGASPSDESDLPVDPLCVDRLRGHVERVRHASRYFNAVSADVRISSLPALAAEPFVVRIDCVASESVPRDPGIEPPLMPVLPGELAPALEDPYGLSRCQLEQIGAIELLDDGVNASGAAGGGGPVLVAILDSGFRLDHEALGGVGVEARWDFVQGDSNVSDEAGDPFYQDRHGTLVLGVIAGRSDGNLYGPAWGARYLLAKTEIIDEEIVREEDNWIAGIEWADSAGADIVTSSLGYSDWYAQSDLDGETPLCTRAADIAVSHGIVVVNSVGNLGTGGIVAPADGDSVIAVGAVDCGGEIAYFSSRGPTADGRIKPDFVAMGYPARSVAYPDTTGFGYYNGTSFAAPLVAGICAQLLELHPDWDPVEMRSVLRATASRSGFPDNTYGYGLPSATLAAGWPATLATGAPFPNPFSGSTRAQYVSPALAPVTVRVYDCRGALVRTLASGRPSCEAWSVSWDGTNEAGRRVASGVYFLVASSAEISSRLKVIHVK